MKSCGKVDETFFFVGGNAHVVELAVDQHASLGALRVTVVDQQLQYNVFGSVLCGCVCECECVCVTTILREHIKQQQTRT